MTLPLFIGIGVLVYAYNVASGTARTINIVKPIYTPELLLTA